MVVSHFVDMFWNPVQRFQGEAIWLYHQLSARTMLFHTLSVESWRWSVDLERWFTVTSGNP